MQDTDWVDSTNLRICGFPAEGEEDHRASMDLATRLGGARVAFLRVLCGAPSQLARVMIEAQVRLLECTRQPCRFASTTFPC